MNLHETAKRIAEKWIQEDDSEYEELERGRLAAIIESELTPLMEAHKKEIDQWTHDHRTLLHENLELKNGTCITCGAALSKTCPQCEKVV